MQFTRTFHAVGQGAFYIEQHFDDLLQYTIVYDCGTRSMNEKAFQKKLSGILPAGITIDLLIISHFHDDHINKIEYLRRRHKISYVIIPLLTEEAKTLIKIENLLKYNSSDSRIIDNPSGFFGKRTTVIEISPDESGISSENDNLEPFIIPKIDNSNSDKSPIAETKKPKGAGLTIKKPSGTKFKIEARNKEFWQYIPYNYEFQSRSYEFIGALKLEGINYNELTDWDLISANLDKVQRAYGKLEKNLNNNSLVVYSGCLSKSITLNHIYPNQTNSYFNYYFHPGRNEHNKNRHGCIYTGDIDLTIDTTSKSIQRKFSNYLASLSIIQVPHHGSIHNFEKDLFTAPVLAVMSYGTTNTYGHPAPYVIQLIHLQRSTPVHITEEEKTCLMSYCHNYTP